MQKTPIKNIDFSFGHSGPQNWSPQGEWYFDKKRSGGGVLIDLGSHKIDTVLWLLNKKKPKNISLKSTFNKRFGIEDNTTLIIEFEEQEMAILHSSWTLKSKPINNLTVYCKKGKLEVKDNTLKISTDLNTTYEKLQKLPSIGHNAKKIAMERIISNFLECIVNKEQPLITGNDGLRSLEIVLTGYKSLF